MQLMMNGPAQACALASPGESSSAKARLLAAVHEATDAMARGQASSLAAGMAEPDARFSELLRLLTYCYANGIYASVDIEMALSRDPVLRHLANGRHHESGVIRSFRRRHRLTLQRCLARALAANWEQDHAATGIWTLLASGCSGLMRQRWDGQASTPNFEEEAAGRMHQAICIDTALLDE